MHELPVTLTIYIYTLTAILGLCVGSFLNCFAYRYSKQESVIKGRSKCALCGRELGALDLVPVFSWIFLRGKCRYCGGKISPLHILAEIICALAYISVVTKFGITPSIIKYLLLASLLIAAAFADTYCGLIPDRLIIIGTVSAFLISIIPPLESDALKSLSWTLVNGLSVSLPLLLTVLLLDRIMKKETMGGGDIKIIFLVGLYFDWKLNILILIFACAIGIVFSRIKWYAKKEYGNTAAVPFAPAIALAVWAVMLWGDGIIRWYLGFFN